MTATLWQPGSVPRESIEAEEMHDVGHTRYEFLRPVRDGLFETGDPKVEVVRMICEGGWVAAPAVGQAATDEHTAAQLRRMGHEA